MHMYTEPTIIMNSKDNIKCVSDGKQDSQNFNSSTPLVGMLINLMGWLHRN